MVMLRVLIVQFTGDYFLFSFDDSQLKTVLRLARLVHPITLTLAYP